MLTEKSFTQELSRVWITALLVIFPLIYASNPLPRQPPMCIFIGRFNATFVLLQLYSSIPPK